MDWVWTQPWPFHVRQRETSVHFPFALDLFPHREDFAKGSLLSEFWNYSCCFGAHNGFETLLTTPARSRFLVGLYAPHVVFRLFLGMVLSGAHGVFKRYDSKQNILDILFLEFGRYELNDSICVRYGSTRFNDMDLRDIVYKKWAYLMRRKRHTTRSIAYRPWRRRLNRRRILPSLPIFNSV